MDYKIEIERLKKKRNAVILAHYYTVGEVQEVADFIGDSLALSEAAAATQAEIILFAGVHFMAETAKILSPHKKVLHPEPKAGCSLAESCPAAEFKKFISRYPEHKVISYVNTTADVKALTDICCTSSNALRVVESVPEEQGIIFGPDRNLGNYIKSITGKQNMVIWDGACHVHEQFSLEKILDLKQQYPDAKVLAHPECKAPILLVADFVGSTAAILNFCSVDDADTYIVVTEPGILYQMKKLQPDKTFIPAPPIDSTCGCNDCEFMKMITLENIYTCLRDQAPEILIPEDTINKAVGSIKAMLEI